MEKKFKREDQLHLRDCFEQFTPLNTPPELILVHLVNDPELHWPKAMKPGVPRDQSKYCCFYRDHVHEVSDCIKLKKQIENLIQRGCLRRFIQAKPELSAQPHLHERREDRLHCPKVEPQQPLGEIRVIFGGFVGNEESNSSPSAHARRLQLARSSLSKKPSKDRKMEE